MCCLAFLALLPGCSTMHLGRAGGVASPTTANEPAKSPKHGKGATSLDPLAEAGCAPPGRPSRAPYREAELRKAGSPRTPRLRCAPQWHAIPVMRPR
jgi:hypothetical protein